LSDFIVVGDVMMDVVLKSDRKIVNALKVGGTNYFVSSQIVPGGCGNIGAAISHLGGKTALIGKAGQDAYGRVYLQDLESRGIVARLEFDRSVSTGLAVSLVEPEGHRTMLVSRGANDNLTMQEVASHLRELGHAEFLYVSGYSLVSCPQRDAVQEAVRLGRDLGMRIAFDPGSANLIRSFREVFEQVVESCDILCANAEEAEVLADGLKISEYVRLLSRKDKLVVVKTGSKGCLVVVGGKLSSLPGVEANCVDTTGAGDAFLGALLYSLSIDLDLTDSASFANWFAARKTEGLGPRHFPSREDAGSILRSIRDKRPLTLEVFDG
jgi:sugar/nucleoside kinase (ribokinase family)